MSLSTDQAGILFELTSNYQPAGDQPQAIEQLTSQIEAGLAYQTLLGVTGSGKTYTMANVIVNVQRPTIVLAHNKTLAAQLYGEFKAFFPNNAVEYFVSYYDYYQPEAYVPASDTFIDKDSSINEHVERMRLSATKALLQRSDVIIVATVSAIYGLGDPEQYLKMVLHLSRGEKIDQRKILQHLANLQYRRNDVALERATYRVTGDVIDIHPADSEKEAIRIELFDDEIERIVSFDPLLGTVHQDLPRVTIFPKTHYATSRDTLLNALDEIKVELKSRLEQLYQANKLVEAQRLRERTQYDIEMIIELGYCSGVENYSRYLSGRPAGSPPPTLLDYMPKDALMMIDESHVTVPQIGAMSKGDRSRKETLVEYGFRLPSAMDNRPLNYEEFKSLQPQTIFVSATPGDYELEQCDHQTIDLVVRPTGLLDPILEVRPVMSQVDDLLSEIHLRIAKDERVLVTTLTKKMSENLSDYYHDQGLKVRYLHSDIDTVERAEIIRDLRLGVFDVLIGINLLREGLDMPEVSLVAILDADKEGFLRSYRALIQTIGRAARHLNGKAILYADKMTKSMRKAIDETQSRREKQMHYNQQHGIVPTSIQKAVHDVMERPVEPVVQSKDMVSDLLSTDDIDYDQMTPKQKNKQLVVWEKEMVAYSDALDFEQAALLRDKIAQLKVMLGVTSECG